MKSIVSASKNINAKRRRLLLLVGIVVLLLLALFIGRSFIKEKDETKTATVEVSRGNIVCSIEGSGVLEANDQYTISSLVTGEVLSDTFEEGDMVTRDDLLYVIDSTNLDFTLQKAESGVASAQLAYEESLDMLANQTVKAPISGVITSLSVKEGDEIGTGMTVAEIINADRMLLSLPFLSSDAQSIYPGASAAVVPENAPSETLSGTVKSVASGSTVSTLGASVTMVEILVENPGGLLEGGRASASVGTYACHDFGTLSYEDTKKVTVKTGGTVTNLAVRLGDRVGADDILFRLESESTARSAERSRLSYNDAVLSRENTYDQLEDYQIKAPISGKIIQKTVKAGDKLESGMGSNASSMAIIADLSALTFEMMVDELDIAKIQKGQEVRITADAVSGQIFKGHVENVSIVGTATNGVTSYPVKVVLDDAENTSLIPGMNVSATIVTESRENVLVIPASAISRGNIVTVRGDAPSEMPEGVEDPAAEHALSLEAPAGYRFVRIETGISDGRNIEVLSGLSEGDVLLIDASKGTPGDVVIYTRGGEEAVMGGMPMGGMRMGAMGGGMPMGGGR